MIKKPHQISRKIISSLKFIELEEITWQGCDGKTRVWDAAERVGRLEAVMMIAKLMPSNRLVLINQYRPPVNDYVIEFPAGIIDKFETPEKTALRELKEETGYIGNIVHKTPPTLNTPGLTSEAVYQFYIEIDENMAENKDPQPKPDEGEHIEVLLVNHDKLNHFINNEFQKGTLIDSKVVSYIQGIRNAGK